MFISDLTTHELRAFKFFKSHFKCPVCGQPVDITDGFEMVKIKYCGRIYHSFPHTQCLLSQLKKEEEK